MIKKLTILILSNLICELSISGEINKNKMIYSIGPSNIEWVSADYMNNNSLDEKLRPFVPAFLIGGVKRISYDIFSSQEIEQFEDLIAENEKKIRTIKNKKETASYEKIIRNLAWPKIYAMNGQICVNQLQKAIKSVAINHLICVIEPSKSE